MYTCKKKYLAGFFQWRFIVVLLQGAREECCAFIFLTMIFNKCLRSRQMVSDLCGIGFLEHCCRTYVFFVVCMYVFVFADEFS
jgi:hypothetical protein